MNNLNYDIDVIIPTFNSQRSLKRCLDGVFKQDYPWDIKVTIIDGGSSDNTIEIAKKYELKVIVKEGMYGTGLNGARHFGELITNAPFVWLIDSDNVLVENNVAKNLIKPFVKDPSIDIVYPSLSIDRDASGFNNWFSVQAIQSNREYLKRCTFIDDYYITNDLAIGIQNCALIKRTSLEQASGYDSDVRLLDRMRRLNIAKAAIDPNSHFYHNQVDSVVEFFKKLDRRMKKFSKFSDKDYSEYFVEWPIPSFLNKNLRSVPIKNALKDPYNSLRQLVATRDLSQLWGLVYSAFLYLYIITHFRLVKTVYDNFL